MSNENISLKEHFGDKFKSLEKSIDIAKAEVDRRLNDMNEFRHQLDRQAATFVTKESFEGRFETIDKDKRYSIALVISLLSLLATVLIAILK